MADKILNTRIQQKHDIEANWLKAENFTPKAGEIIVYDPDENYDYQRIKIGDGERLLSNLPFITEAITPEQIAAVCGIVQIYGNQAVL